MWLSAPIASVKAARFQQFSHEIATPKMLTSLVLEFVDTSFINSLPKSLAS